MNNLSDKELLHGYKQIVLYFEQEVRKDKTGFNKKTLKGFLDRNGIEIFTSSNVERDYQELIGKKRKALLLCSQKDYDIPLLLRLLRNSFAHGNIRKEKVGGHFFIIFFNVHHSKRTFAGQIPSSKFAAFIDALKGCRRII